jgi:ankyrin repeat protein
LPVQNFITVTASRFGFVKIAELLLGFGAKTEEKEISGFTPLLTACKEGHKEVVSLLIKHGANVNQANNLGFCPVVRNKFHSLVDHFGYLFLFFSVCVNRLLHQDKDISIF